MGDKKKKIHKLEISGKNVETFKKLRPNLIKRIFEMFEPIDEEDYARNQASLSFEFLEEKIKRGSIENYKIVAEIEEKFSKAEKNKAEARKIDAEAKKINFDNKLNEMKLFLGLNKAMLLGNKNKEAIVFVKEIDSLIEVIENVQEEQRLAK